VSEHPSVEVWSSFLLHIILLVVFVAEIHLYSVAMMYVVVVGYLELTA